MPDIIQDSPETKSQTTANHILQHHQQQTAHTLHGHNLSCIAINFLMLIASAISVPANSLALNKLRNAPFWLPKQPVSAAKTGRFIMQSGPFHGPMWRIRKNKTEENVFSHISADMGRMQIAIITTNGLATQKWATTFATPKN